MNRKTMVCLVLCAALLLGLGGAAVAAQVDCDTVYCFTREDFSRQEGLVGVCITALPDSEAGTVLLGTRVIRSGDILTTEQLSKLTFQALRTEEDCTATVTYLPVFENRVEPDASMTISIHGKVNQAPVAEDSTVETYKNLPNEGHLKVKDPEGETMTFSVIRQPKRGSVTVREDGTFLYTPRKNKVGTDSFVYTATDASGKVSREATVTIQILKPTAVEEYTDTVGLDCRFAAEWMKHTGLFIGEQVGGELCFQPEKTVSRGEFLVMLVNALEIPVDGEASFTGFSDDAPEWLKPYLAAALRTGISAGWPYGDSFQPDSPVTGAEAALLLQNALELPVSTAGTGKDNDSEIPAWANTAVSAMAQNGIALTAYDLTRGEVAELLYQATKLADTAPGLEVYR